MTDLFNQNPTPSSPERQAGKDTPLITLVPEQQVVHDGLLQNWLPAGGKNPVLFTGSAGTGKSTTLTVLLNTIRKMGLTVGVAAPTHKAVKVMRKNAVPGVDYRTIHSWLQLKPIRNNYTGETVFGPDKFAKEPPPIEGIDVLVHDESSMLSDDVFKYLTPYIQSGLKVVFTGDRIQIPPVKHVDSIVFRNAINWGLLEYNLTKIQRQALGNPIIEFATKIRDDYKAGSFTPATKLLPDGSGIQVVEHASDYEYQILKEFFTSPKFQEDPDYMKLIAWRNETCAKYNDIIRHLIYPNEPNLEGIVIGEKLIMDEMWTVTNRMVIPTNEEIVVEDISYKHETIPWHNGYGEQNYLEVKLYMARVSWYDRDVKKVATLPIVHESSIQQWQGLIGPKGKFATMAREISSGLAPTMWKQFYANKDRYALVGYNYAVTAHTAQGSGYDHTLILKWDIDVNGTWGKPAEKIQKIEERNRILYVAVTRARKTLFIEP